MLARRKLLAGVALGGFAFALGGRRARASWLVNSPLSRHAAAKLSPVASLAEHRVLVGDAHAALRRDIAAGSASADARRIVVCPICCCSMTVTAESVS